MLQSLVKNVCVPMRP
ncbi:unnamed protein product [Gulo gulo]|uniref:Uncharacterized protein n=1 Tax=Gulo gulo TaxID=48420 RepID=A0A9X9PZP0_GULGU|nr:unnamed protein product [Gulo gulo]